MNSSHPKGSRARVLLSSVFGPYAQDDEFGSRAINPMELYHNQVTRVQGSFSAAPLSPLLGHPDDPGEHLRALHGAGLPHPRSVRARADGATTTTSSGISSIIVNVGKAREMCRMVRKLSPRLHHRGGRARGGHSRRRAHARRRPHREGRRHRLDARLPGRGRERPDPPSRARLRASTCASWA